MLYHQFGRRSRFCTSLETDYFGLLLLTIIKRSRPLSLPHKKISSADSFPFVVFFFFSYPLFFLPSFLSVIIIIVGEQSPPADDTTAIITNTHNNCVLFSHFFLSLSFPDPSFFYCGLQRRNGSDGRAVRIYSPRAVPVWAEHSFRLRRRLMVQQFLQHSKTLPLSSHLTLPLSSDQNPSS